MISCVGAGDQVLVLPGSRWSHNVCHYQHVSDDTQLKDTANRLHVLRTVSLALHPAARLHAHDQGMYTVSGKKRTNSILGITSSNTDRFTKFFHFYNLLEICNKAVVKYPIAPKTRHYTHYLVKY